MPRYSYRCNNCEFSFDVWHSIKEQLKNCDQCDSENVLERIPATVRIKSQKAEAPVGATVKEFIEETRKEVLLEKEQLMKKEYQT